MRIVKTAEDRKNEILEVAGQLFVENGYDNASTNDIIKRIGIARGTLYHHFSSKEEILDAIVAKMTDDMLCNARMIVNDKNTPLLERLTGAILAMNVEGDVGAAVLEQIHKPQNALLHQKMFERLLTGAKPVIADLLREGIDAGIFDTDYPDEAAEMTLTYSFFAFDELTEDSEEAMQRKMAAFIYHTERVTGAKPGSLNVAIMKIFNK